MSSIFNQMFDYWDEEEKNREWTDRYGDSVSLWPSTLGHSRYRNAELFTVLGDLGALQTERLLERVIAKMPFVVDIPKSEFPHKDHDEWMSLPPIETVSEESFWSWTGFYSRGLATFIFAFEREADAIQFKLMIPSAFPES